MPPSPRVTGSLAPPPVAGRAAARSPTPIGSRAARRWHGRRQGVGATRAVLAAAAALPAVAAVWLLANVALPGGGALLEAGAAASVLAEPPLLPWLAAGAVLPLSVGAFLLWGRGHGRAMQAEKGVLEARLRAYDDLAPAFDLSAVVLRYPDGTIRHWSVGSERLFGFTAPEATGRLSHELLGTRFPDGGRRTAQEELLRTGDERGELRHRGRGGQAVVVASHWILRRDAATGQPAAVVELHADATPLKAAEAALRAGEARLRLAQEVAGIGTWEWDPEADSLVWSVEQHALFGTSPAAGAPRSQEAFLALVQPEDREAVRAAAARALEAGEYEVEFRILRPGRNGTEEMRWLIGRGRRMRGWRGASARSSA